MKNIVFVSQWPYTQVFDVVFQSSSYLYFQASSAARMPLHGPPSATMQTASAQQSKHPGVVKPKVVKPRVAPPEPNKG